ncbi:hypothetical protein [Aerosakkonema funiforme]|uniref:hypothetical protein n=1 Tax=Aerosakkonema funiforme TaxID=1246630 RepID=UPI0035B8CE56
MTDPYVLFDEARNEGPNPFKLKTIVTADEVWNNVVTDLSSLNHHVDQTIYKAISEVRQKYSNKIGIAIKGDRGTGKSHVIHRIWKTIEREAGAVFAYIPPFNNANRIDYHVRLHLSLSFNHQDARKVTQWQRLAAAMIATLKGTEFEQEYQPYLEKCDRPEELRKYIIAMQPQAQRYQFINDLVQAIEKPPELDPNFLKAVLFLLFKTDLMAQIGMTWIQGTDHPKTKESGLPEFSQEDQDTRSLWIVQQICTVAGIASLPVLICFDQLDSATGNNDNGDSPAQTVARCIDRIYCQCSNVIMLCCVISDTWTEIEKMGTGIPDRVSERSVTTKPPTAEQMLKLVKLRLGCFYKQNNLNSDDYPPLFPFDENGIRSIATKAAGVRDFMNWCADKFLQVIEPDIETKKRKEFLDIYNQVLNQKPSFSKDDDTLATIIASTMEMIPGGGTENVIITEVRHIKEPSHDLHIIICGEDLIHQKKVTIGVRISETTSSQTFIAVMNRLLNYQKHNLTRGCLVRSTELPKSWKKGKQLEEQLKQNGGEVVILKEDELKPLAAIYQIYQEAENYGFSKKEVNNFVKELRLVADNRLIREILSQGTTVA